LPDISIRLKYPDSVSGSMPWHGRLAIVAGAKRLVLRR
jgi:hypothetical protein